MTGGDDLQALLRRRAARLAAPRADGAPRPEGARVLTFRLGEETYGLGIRSLSEAMPLSGWAPVPGWPAELLGVVNRRGALAPVLDLHRLLGLPAPGAPGGTVLFLRARRDVGVRVDSLGEVRSMPVDLPPPAAGAAGPLVEAVGPDGLILLDARRILALDVLGGPAPQPR